MLDIVSKSNDEPQQLEPVTIAFLKSRWVVFDDNVTCDVLKNDLQTHFKAYQLATGIDFSKTIQDHDLITVRSQWKPTRPNKCKECSIREQTIIPFTACIDSSNHTRRPASFVIKSMRLVTPPSG